MEETTLAQLGNYGALGVISAVAIWGAGKGIAALWIALRRSDERLEQAYREFASRLERGNAEMAQATRAAAEENARLRVAMDGFASELAELSERLGEVCDRLEMALLSGAEPQADRLRRRDAA